VCGRGQLEKKERLQMREEAAFGEGDASTVERGKVEWGGNTKTDRN